jgi:hypothetical protein
MGPLRNVNCALGCGVLRTFRDDVEHILELGEEILKICETWGLHGDKDSDFNVKKLPQFWKQESFEISVT